jgi:ABC-type transporter Mla MlaB component
MFSLTAVPGSNGSVTLALSGAVSEEVLPEICRLIGRGQQSKTRIMLDLSEVTLIDRSSARFFAEQMEEGVELVDCPSYLEHWILREVKHEQNR